MEKNITVDYLRLSVTDLCNLNCVYCTPLEKREFLTHQEVLRYEEIARLIRLFIEIGIRKVRITGGEPLIKKNIVALVEMLKKIEGLEEISMTTNGMLLSEYAAQLKKAGLSRVNISLDTLKRDRFKAITGVDSFLEVWEGIQAALAVGFDPVKLNVVPIKGVNDDEIVDFAKLTLKYPLIVRFIELFHTNQRSKKFIESLLSSERTKKLITEELGEIKPSHMIKGEGPASYYKISGSIGSIGFISGSSSNFCHCCNRIRVDCAGRISPCLFSGHIYDTRPLLRSNTQDEKLLEDIKKLLSLKFQYTKYTIKERKIEMSSLGG
ncbi:MAG: GTP 3',8-cyclase MoaA [Omnitrophica bacterium]|nr:GTP 3',8-cyclase MoaA [Candidatus Omnitrophota bacterium]